ncbi:MAG: glucokinase [Halioglobus sp.]
MNTQKRTRLVADVGGTNSRIALWDPALNELSNRCDYLNEDFESFNAVIAAWLAQLNEPAPEQACVAIAAPPFDDLVEMPSIDWSFSIRQTAKQFGFDDMRVINDFEANAYSLPHLSQNDIVTIHQGEAGSSGKLAAVGPGTGLGGAAFGLVAGRPTASACEPGHMSLAPATPMELELFSLLLKKHPVIYAELLLSGRGLPRLYAAVAEVMGEKAEVLGAPEISARAQTEEYPTCSQTMETFCALLGSICGDFVLAQGAYGGLYLCGGILPKMVALLSNSSFQTRFTAKGEMQEYLQAVPIHVITSGRAGLIGAAHTPLS